MIGKTNHGYCLRENKLWYGDKESPACTMPMLDGKSCGDTDIGQERCCYARMTSPSIDYSKLTFITYPQANRRDDHGN